MATIQIREIPEDTYEVIRKRARADGRSIQSYMRDWVVDFAGRPTAQEVLVALEAALAGHDTPGATRESIPGRPRRRSASDQATASARSSRSWTANWGVVRPPCASPRTEVAMYVLSEYSHGYERRGRKGTRPDQSTGQCRPGGAATCCRRGQRRDPDRLSARRRHRACRGNPRTQPTHRRQR